MSYKARMKARQQRQEQIFALLGSADDLIDSLGSLQTLDDDFLRVDIDEAREALAVELGISGYRRTYCRCIKQLEMPPEVEISISDHERRSRFESISEDAPFIDPNTLLCNACGVSHADPCEICSLSGYHADGCPESDAEIGGAK